MPNPTANLFNAGVIPAGWTAQAGAGSGGAVVAEDASGVGAVKLTASSGSSAWYLNRPSEFTMLYAGFVAGDFDVAFTFNIKTHPVVGITAGVVIDLFPSGDNEHVASGMVYVGEPPIPYTIRRTPGGSFADLTTDALRASACMIPGAESGVRALRLKRVGSVLSAYQTDPRMSSPFWSLYGTATDPSSGGACTVALQVGTGGVVALRSFLVLAAGTIAAPAAPTGGSAFSSPSPGDARLSCAAEWDALPSNVAREVEYWSATDAGFTAGVEVVPGDKLLDGQPLSYRRNRGVAAGTTVYFRCRARNELGALGAFSAVVSAVAAVTPAVSPSFVYPPGSFKRPALEFRL